MGEYQDNSLGSRVFQRLREDILSGKYKEHDELRENTLGKELGVSRTPVREHSGSWSWKDWSRSYRTKERM